jgi:hypothetical protein
MCLGTCGLREAILYDTYRYSTVSMLAHMEQQFNIQSAVQNFPKCYETRNFVNVFKRVLSQINPIRRTTIYFLKMHINVIFLHKPKSL